MKKLFIVIAAALFITGVQAQEKISKSALVGKWTITSVEMQGMFSYDLEKDTIILGDMLKAQVSADQLSMVLAAMKPQLAVLTKMGFVFNADGSAELGTGTDMKQSGTYKVNEAESTITTIDKDGKEDVFKAEMVKEKLKMNINSPQGAVQMMFKKSVAQ
jgi:hypothetical protein